MNPEIPKLSDDCFVHDKDRLRHDEALEILQRELRTVVGSETVTLSQATGRVLATDISAPRNIPAFNNSAVDGYAYSHADYEQTGGFFPVATRIAAGDSNEIELPGFTAARIFTGAPMPQGADTVAMQEDCEPHIQDGGRFVAIPGGLKPGANCRLAGEDVNQGEVVAHHGLRLRPQDVAAIASTGTDCVSVHKPLKIGLLSSGNEVLRAGQPYEPGKVYDANQPMLLGLLNAMGCSVTDLGVSPDNPEQLEKLLTEAAGSNDVVLTTGGASKGEEDHFVDILEKIGKRHLWQLAVKPGRPMCFGQIGDTLCFTLPGNPVAAFVCFLLYVRPSLIRLGGAAWQHPARYAVPAGFSITSKPDRREFLRGILSTDDTGKTIVRKFERDGSGLISGLRQSSGLIEVPEETTSIAEGQLVDFIPYTELGIN